MKTTLMLLLVRLEANLATITINMTEKAKIPFPIYGNVLHKDSRSKSGKAPTRKEIVPDALDQTGHDILSPRVAEETNLVDDDDDDGDDDETNRNAINNWHAVLVSVEHRLTDAQIYFKKLWKSESEGMK